MELEAINWTSSAMGTLPGHVWFWGMIWSLIGAAFVKVRKLPTNIKFNFRHWLNDNVKDLLQGFLISLIVLRMSNYAYVLVKEWTEMKFEMPSDFVVFMILVGGFAQYYFHKNRTPISKTLEVKLQDKIK